MFKSEIDQALERQLLEREKPPSHVTAERQLKAAKIEFKRIVAANPEAILYVNESGRAWTAWSEVKDDGKTIVFYRQEGFPALPSPYLKDSQ